MEQEKESNQHVTMTTKYRNFVNLHKVNASLHLNQAIPDSSFLLCSPPISPPIPLSRKFISSLEHQTPLLHPILCPSLLKNITTDRASQDNV